MNATMTHRGPDDEGAYVDRESGVTLGARRLSIIDVEGGHQPVSNEGGDVWAVLNGELYNHPALRKRLIASGHHLRSGTDTEVLVHLYEELGEELVHALEGMYAFALWDARRGRLLLCRDRFGEKPLFYTEHGGALTFASELTTLLAGASVSRELDPAAVDAFFVFGYVPGSEAIVRGVREVPPGHTLCWERGRPEPSLRAYWHAPAPAGPPAEPFDQLVAEAGRLLEGSVASRMISDVPLGVFLSGGVDSSLIAALAARASSRRIKTFTVGYDVGGVAETTEARRVADAIGADHHELTLTEVDVARRVPELFGRLDQPLADQALVSLHAVSEFARQQVTVVVGGEGADELFGGYPRYRWMARAARLGRMVPDLPARGAARLAGALPLGGRGRRLADVVEPLPLIERHLDWVTDRRRHARYDVYGRALRGVLGSDGLVPRVRAGLNGHAPGDVASMLMQLDRRQWLPDDVLAKADRAGMLNSLEIRTPFLQRELSEFAASLPSSIHMNGGTGKAILRALLARTAPVADRPKTAFRAPAAEWLRGPLAPLLQAQLEAGTAFAEEWFDRERVRRVAAEHTSGVRDWSSLLWPVLTFGLWLDGFRGRRDGITR
jgi:asparagine synthase (glutamine-hydrolysing)